MKEQAKEITNADVVEAIRDLTRVVIATNGEYKSRSELIRKLDSLSMSTARIASLLNMQSKDVASVINKKNSTDGKNKKNATSAIQETAQAVVAEVE